MSKDTREALTAYLLLAPFLVLFVVFLGYPVIYSGWMSMGKVTLTTDWYRVFQDMSYCGLDNYRKLFTADPEFWWSLLLTLAYAALTIPLGIALSLGLALLLSNKVRAVGFFRSAFFLPNVLDPLVVGVLWVFICAPQYGLLEVMLRWLAAATGAHVEATGPIFQGGLLGNPWTVLPVIALAMVLKGAGFGMILFLTAIQNIPGDLYEAADLDGATAWDKLIHITLPFVKPIILFMLITGVSGSLNAFTEIYAMTGGEGGPATEVNLPTAEGFIHVAAWMAAWVAGAGILGLFVRWVKELTGNKAEWDRWILPSTMLVALVLAAKFAPQVGTPVRFTGRAASVSGFYLFKTFERGDYGYAAAIAFVLMGVALLISALNMRLMRQGD
jgi:multiple sugar transport system permease protein